MIIATICCDMATNFNFFSRIIFFPIYKLILDSKLIIYKHEFLLHGAVLDMEGSPGRFQQQYASQGIDIPLKLNMKCSSFSGIQIHMYIGRPYVIIILIRFKIFISPCQLL